MRRALHCPAWVPPTDKVFLRFPCCVCVSLTRVGPQARLWRCVRRLFSLHLFVLGGEFGSGGGAAAQIALGLAARVAARYFVGRAALGKRLCARLLCFFSFWVCSIFFCFCFCFGSCVCACLL
jgi:hypothetical protein